jgi:hypothetical protein
MQEDNTLAPLISMPKSLKTQFERAQNLLNQSEHAENVGDHSLAVVKAREAMQAVGQIAQRAPELAMLLLAGDMGYSGYEIETIERIDRHEVIERKFLGISFGSEVVNVPTVTRRVIRGRLL